VRRVPSRADRVASFRDDLEQEQDAARRARLIKLGVSQDYCNADGEIIEDRGPRTLNDEIRDAGRNAIRLRSLEAGAQGERQPERETLNDAVRRAREEGTVRHVGEWDTRRTLL
jgi:hypothetical protein